MLRVLKPSIPITQVVKGGIVQKTVGKKKRKTA